MGAALWSTWGRGKFGHAVSTGWSRHRRIVRGVTCEEISGIFIRSACLREAPQRVMKKNVRLSRNTYGNLDRYRYTFVIAMSIQSEPLLLFASVNKQHGRGRQHQQQSAVNFIYNSELMYTHTNWERF